MEDTRLFGALLAEGLLTLSPDSGRGHLPDPDMILAMEAGKAAHPGEMRLDAAARERCKPLITALYHSGPGRVIRRQVALWNATRRFAAVRDDRPRPVGDNITAWRAYHRSGGSAEPVSTGAAVPAAFGYVNGGVMEPGFSDWCAAHAEGDAITFRTTLRMEVPGVVTVQVIGGKPRVDRQSGFRLVQEKRCKRGGASCSDADSDAFVLTFDLPKGEHDIGLTVEAVRNSQPVVPGLAIRQIDDPPGLAWVNPRPHAGIAAARPLRILTADDVALTDDHGRPTAECERFGLVPLVGNGRHTPYALWGVCAGSPLPPGTEDVHLTIEATLQGLARETLERHLQADWCRNDQYEDDRRAALVVLDAESGEILAAAGRPQPPAGVHPWDLAAFSLVYPTRNPMTVTAWRGGSRHYTPGSTFKPITAMAAMTASETVEGLRDYLEGYPTRSFQRRTGLPLSCRRYAPETMDCSDKGRGIRNFGGFPIRNAFNRGKTLGLTAAVRDSINVWFAHLAVMMDGQAARGFDKTDSKPDPPELFLARTARCFGFGGPPLDLAGTGDAAHRLRRRLPRGSGEGDVLFAHTGRMDLMDPSRGALLWMLAQNSIGQGVTAMPLQMARVAAAIGTGRLRTPRLIRRIGDDAVDSFPALSLDLPSDSMALLRAGMKAVT